MDGVVVFPRLHADNGFGEVGEIVQCTSHRAEDTSNTFLASHASVDSNLWPTASAAAQGVDTAPGSGDPNGAGHIRPDTNTTTESQESTFTTSRTTRRVFRNMRVAAMTPKSVGRLERQ